jgi:outer membrane immunogenic protein
MKKLLSSITAIVAAVVATPSLGADMPLKAPPPPAPLVSDWTGFYAGLGLGLRANETDGSVLSASATSGGAPLSTIPCARPCATSEPLNGAAFRVAPYAGFNWQIDPRWVIGVEADWGWAGRTVRLNGIAYPTMGGSVAVPGSGLLGDSFAVKTDWDASARFRLGYLVEPRFLVYATGGAAWLHMESISNCNTGTFIFLNSKFSATCGGPVLLNPSTIAHATDVLGWTIGAGTEFMLRSNWVARAEYRYADFGTVSNVDTRSCTGAGMGSFPCILGGTTTVAYDVHVRTHLAMIGLAYKFGDSGAAPLAQPVAFPTKAPPAAPILSWSGPYVGLGVGLRVGEIVGSAGLPTGFVPFCAGIPCALDEPLNGTAFRVSPYVGFNWQPAPRWVAGFEADLGFASRTVALTGVAYPSTFFFRSEAAADSFAVKTTWDASARARVGFLVDPRFLVYATGGPAWLHVESTSTCVFPPERASPLAVCSSLPSVIAHATTKLGGTLGIGSEAAFWSNWVARAEYRYSDYGHISYSDTHICPAGLCGAADVTTINNYDLRVRTHMATFGLAYKFGAAGPVVASY